MRPAQILPSLTLRSTPAQLALKPRYRPWLCAGCFYGLVGLVCAVMHYFNRVHPLSGPGPYTPMTPGVLHGMDAAWFFIASIMVIVPIYQETRPPILVYDRKQRRLLVPRLGLVFERPYPVMLGMREETEDLSGSEDGGMRTGDVLYLCRAADDPQATKLHTEYLYGDLLRCVTPLAKEAGVKTCLYTGGAGGSIPVSSARSR